MYCCMVGQLLITFFIVLEFLLVSALFSRKEAPKPKAFARADAVRVGSILQRVPFESVNVAQQASNRLCPAVERCEDIEPVVALVIIAFQTCYP